MKIKTSELTGTALDWAVAKSQGYAGIALQERTNTEWYSPSTDWAQGGPIIEREEIAVVYRAGGYWLAYTPESKPSADGTGPIPLIAAMRCYVAFHLGDEVDVPEELL
jgi:hypothetical protein